ncbi:uncharacterized protein LOC116160637 [Photinus pyralis]|nr:uncharacterized protein LOC116160637 [Photinus pyralis]
MALRLADRSQRRQKHCHHFHEKTQAPSPTATPNLRPRHPMVKLIQIGKHSCNKFIYFLEPTSVDNENQIPVEELPTPAVNQINDELLISLVYARKPLWDFRTPVQERHGLKLKKLWEEVAVLLGGQLIDAVKKRWRQLRDDFMRARKKHKTYVPSGSGADHLPPQPTFKYYELMRFLDDTENMTTISNVSLGPSTSNSGAEIIPSGSPSPSLSSHSVGNKKKRVSEARSEGYETEIQKEILKVMQAPESKPDGVDGFLVLLGEGLRRLPLRNRNKLQIRFLQLLEGEESILNNE